MSSDRELRFAAIDLGSNTVKQTIARVDDSGAMQALEEQAIVTRIGQDLDRHGELRTDAIERTFTALKDMVERSRRLGVLEIACVGTAGLRGAKNAPDFLRRVEESLCLSIEIIDGLREAELAYRAPAAAFGNRPLVVVDVGGRSTEVIVGEGPNIHARVSLDMGSVRFTERYIRQDPPGDEELNAIKRAVRAQFQAAPDHHAMHASPTLVGVSGTVMSLMGLALGVEDMAEAVERGEGQKLERTHIEASYDDLRRKTTPQRVRGSVIPEGRADVIVAGTLIVLGALDRYGASVLHVSNRGVRYGLLEEMRLRHTSMGSR